MKIVFFLLVFLSHLILPKDYLLINKNDSPLNDIQSNLNDRHFVHGLHIHIELVLFSVRWSSDFAPSIALIFDVCMIVGSMWSSSFMVLWWMVSSIHLVLYEEFMISFLIIEPFHLIKYILDGYDDDSDRGHLSTDGMEYFLVVYDSMVNCASWAERCARRQSLYLLRRRKKGLMKSSVHITPTEWSWKYIQVCLRKRMNMKCKMWFVISFFFWGECTEFTRRSNNNNLFTYFFYYTTSYRAITFHPTLL